MNQETSNNKEEVLDEVEDFININQLEDSSGEVEVVLNNVNFAKVFLVLYYMEKKQVCYTRKQIAIASKIELCNSYKYIDYFVHQGFAELKKNPRFSKRMAVVKTKTNSNKWESLIKLALKTIRDKVKRSE